MTPKPAATAASFLSWAKSMNGVREGSARVAQFDRAAGSAPGIAWCAAFVAAGLRRLGITPPKDPASAASYESWSGGEKITGGLANARPGDLLTFHWPGATGISHIAIYKGNGRMTQGNDADGSVGESGVPTESLVSIIRPKAFGGGAEGASPANLIGPAVKEATNSAGEAISSIAPSAKEIAEGAFSLLGVNANAIMLNIGLIGGGAFLAYYGIALLAGAKSPVKTPATTVAKVAK